MSETITHVEALKRLKASMETMPWERRSAREDSWIRFIDEALAAPDRQSAADALAAALDGFIDAATDGRPIPEWVSERLSGMRAALAAWDKLK